MNITHIVPHISAEAAGPSYSVPRLCESLAARGHAVTLACLGTGRDMPGVHLDLHPSWPIVRRFAISPAHARAQRTAAGGADIVHNHSLWSMVNVAAGIVVPGHRAKLVTSPRGTLSDWAMRRSSWIKRLVWPLQKCALSRANLLHATSEQEFRDIRARGFMAPVAIIPNGIDLPELTPRTPNRNARTLLFLSRIHPIKSVETLLDAWALIQAAHPDWRLVIGGPGERTYVDTLRARVGQQGLRDVSFPGSLYGSAKSLAYRGADLFVLPTHSENFGMVVAEALAHECPVVVSRGAPWQGLEPEGCGWWVANDSENLARALGEAMAQPRPVLQRMGEKGRSWMERDFAWPGIAERLEAAYRWLLDGGQAPGMIRTE